MRCYEQTHCKRGHALSGENIRLLRRGKYIHRVCIACQEIGRRAYTIRRVRARLAS